MSYWICMLISNKGQGKAYMTKKVTNLRTYILGRTCQELELELSSSSAFSFTRLSCLASVITRPLSGSTGRMSLGPPFRPIASMGGGGSKPARKRRRWTGSEGCAPTESQYLYDDWRNQDMWEHSCISVNKYSFTIPCRLAAWTNLRGMKSMPILNTITGSVLQDL